MKWPIEHRIEEEKVRNEGKKRRKREEKRTKNIDIHEVMVI
jgi:hypothetical protein